MTKCSGFGEGLVMDIDKYILKWFGLILAAGEDFDYRLVNFYIRRYVVRGDSHSNLTVIILKSCD